MLPFYATRSTFRWRYSTTATDDASLVEAAGGSVRVVEAPPSNFKVTAARRPRSARAAS